MFLFLGIYIYIYTAFFLTVAIDKNGKEISSKPGVYPPFGFSFPALGNFPDRRGGGLACHGEPFDHATVETRILEQIKCLKDSGKNSTLPNHQIPFLNISQRLELVST